MSEQPQNEYLKAKIMTATPSQLQTMLYDGAIRFCEQAKVAMEEKDISTTHERMMRAQRIVLELSSNMNATESPDLCGKLASLYNYVYRLLIDANLQKDMGKLDEAIELLRYQRDTWLMAMNALQNDGATANADDKSAVVDSAQIPAPVQLAMPALPAIPKPTTDAGALVGGTLSVEG